MERLYHCCHARPGNFFDVWIIKNLHCDRSAHLNGWEAQRTSEYSLINLESIWGKVREFDALAANNLAHEFVGNGGVAGANDEISSDERGQNRNGGKIQGTGAPNSP